VSISLHRTIHEGLAIVKSGLAAALVLAMSAESGVAESDGAEIVDSGQARCDWGVAVALAADATPYSLRTAAGQELRLLGVSWRGRASGGGANLPAIGDSLCARPAEPVYDRYGRRLVVARRPAAARSLQEELLSRGLVLFQPQQLGAAADPPWLQEDWSAMAAAETDARLERLGLWRRRDAPFWRAGDPSLARASGGHVVLEGLVLEAGGPRGDLYLNFGEDWGSDTTVRIDSSVIDRWPEEAREPGYWVDRRVRIRGWLRFWNGPFMDLHHPAQIERLEEAVAEPKTGAKQGQAP